MPDTLLSAGDLAVNIRVINLSWKIKDAEIYNINKFNIYMLHDCQKIEEE